MASYNRVTFLGNLTRDPEVTTFANGGAVAKFGLAVNEDYKDKNGEKVEKAMFIDVEVWNMGSGKQADHAAQYLSKGRQVLIEGSLDLQTWQDKNDGSKRSKHVVKCTKFVFVGKRDDGGGGGDEQPQDEAPRRQAPPQRQAQNGPPAKRPAQKSYAPPEEDNDSPFADNDDIPF